MTVKELIEKLKQFDENKQIMFFDNYSRELREPKVCDSELFEDEIHIF